MNKIPPKLRVECAADPYYTVCARNAELHDHVCKADPLTRKLIDWEHVIIFANNQLQKKWAIIPACWWSHRGPGLVKEIHEWIALNRATDDELRAISKAIDYIHKRNYLNGIYGIPKLQSPKL